ncbi:putative development/cell death domain-containing protein [Helianthus annuus]|nr:putative development/cell death domain-containing protein [Helianthus annuus]
MGYKGNSVHGEVPERGAIFMSNINTHKECLERKLFGLPSGMSKFVLHVKEGMTLFLFEFERRLLYGVFRATCDGDINIDPKAFRSSGKQFPAQVRFTTVWECSPLAESEFKDVIRDNYFSGKKFNFGLDEKQVRKLMKLFRSKIISKNYPERNIRRYNKPEEANARSGDLRKDIRHRIRFDSCDLRGDEVKEVDDNMYINKHIIEDRQTDKREGFLTHYTTESDEFGDYSRHDILGKHLDLREKDIEDQMRTSTLFSTRMTEFDMPVFSKPHGTHLDEIGIGSKDIIDYNRLQDEYKVRERLRESLNERTLTNDYSHFNHNDYSNVDTTRVDVPDIQLSPCLDDGSGFISIANNYPIYSSPEKIPMTYYSHDEGSYRYRDDPGSQSSIFPKFISRNLSLSSSDARLRVDDVDPTDDDKRCYEKHESKRSFGSTRKRESVFSRLSSTLRHEEQAFETDENHELNSSVNKVMKMLEKVVSSPKKRSGKSISVIKQDDADNSPKSKIEDYVFPDVNLEVDADVVDEEAEGESAYQETRLVDFKRRKKSNKRIDDANKENSECLVGTTSDVGPVANNLLTGMPHKRRKLVRPDFVEKNIVPDSGGTHENKLSANDSTDVAVEGSEKVDALIESVVPTCRENTPDDSSLTKAESESSKKVDVSIKHCAHENTLFANDSSDAALEGSEKVDALIESMVPACHENTPDDGSSTKAGSESSKKVEIDLNMLPTSDESSSSKEDNVSTKAVLKSQNSVVVEGLTSNDDQKMCGWIEW